MRCLLLDDRRGGSILLSVVQKLFNKTFPHVNFSVSVKEMTKYGKNPKMIKKCTIDLIM